MYMTDFNHITSCYCVVRMFVMCILDNRIGLNQMLMTFRGTV